MWAIHDHMGTFPQFYLKVKKKINNTTCLRYAGSTLRPQIQVIVSLSYSNVSDSLKVSKKNCLALNFSEVFKTTVD